LNAERDADNGKAQDQTSDNIFKKDEQAAKYDPDDIAYKIHFTVFIEMKG
jgi:hypothetical protein